MSNKKDWAKAPPEAVQALLDALWTHGLGGSTDDAVDSAWGALVDQTPTTRTLEDVKAELLRVACDTFWGKACTSGVSLLAANANQFRLLVGEALKLGYQR